MDIFTWLLMGHLIGDWLLQNDWMARNKRQSLFTLAGMVHFTIYTATIIGVVWLSGLREKGLAFYIIAGLIIFVSHWLVDATNVVQGWMRFYRQSNLAIMRVMVDQTLHLIVLVWLSLFFGSV